MAETYDAKIFQRDGVAMVLYPDGDEAVLADVMRYMNPGAEFDEATGLQMATPPPPAESATYSRSTVQDKPFGSIAGSMAEPYMTQAYDALTRTPVVDPNSYVPQSVQRINQAVGSVGGAGLSGLLGLIYGGAGLAGDVANATGVGGGQRLANDLAGMVDVAGVGPEARMVEMLSNAGAGRSIARTVAERANQRGPVPVMGSNFANLLGDVEKPSTGITAYHNSPHDFNRFSMSQIGTGEGAQAYGHGLYFAESPSVSGRGGDYWKQFFNKMPSGPERTATGAMYANKFDAEKAASQLEANVRYHADRAKPGKYADGPEVEEGNRLLAEENQQALDMIRSGQIVGPRTYEVNINADPNKFLDWDKPLSEQPEVANLLGYSDAARIAADRKKLYGQFSAPKSLEYEDLFGPLSANEKAAAQQLSAMPEPWNEMTGKDAWFRASKRKYVVEGPDGRLGPGGNTYEEALQVAGGDANKVRTMYDPAAPARAEFMREAGIPGIKYLDQGSRGAGAGSSNYVVFDDKLVSIVKKYGIAGAAAMLGVSAVDVEEAMARGQPPQGLLSMGSK